MRILSLNTWHGERKAELREFLLAHIDTTDIFCLQETVGDSIEAIIADLFTPALFDFAVTEKISKDDAHYRSHIFVKKPLKITHSEPLLAVSDSDIGRALAVNIEVAGDILSVINVHGAPFPGHKLDTSGRLRQTEQLLDWVSKDDLPSVICGDFNLLPETKSIAQFTAAGYKNLIADYGIPTTRNRLTWDRHPVKQLFADYAFTSADLHVTSFNVTAVEVSDHLPMILDIEMPTR